MPAHTVALLTTFLAALRYSGLLTHKASISARLRVDDRQR
jgi:uncharacterized membrane protein